MPRLEVIDAKDAPLLPGMQRFQMPDGRYEVFMPGETPRDRKKLGNGP